jgi:hypothetical protein
MREPEAGKENLGAVIGAVTGAVGGLFAVVTPLAIINRNIRELGSARTLGIVSFMVCVPVGWFVGGRVSHALVKKLGNRKASIVGGLIGGLLPVIGFALWGWYLVTH